MPEFVVLEGLKEGNRFYSPYTEGDDPTRLYDGTIAYKLLGFANTDEEARAIIRRGNPKSEIEIMSRRKICLKLAEVYLLKNPVMICLKY